MRRACELLLPLILIVGCSRPLYRNWADRDTYGAIEERNADPRYRIPHIDIDPPPAARFHDAFDPNFPPMPPDDPDAAQYMIRANGMPGYRKWHKNGDAPWIEDPRWRELLGLSDDNVLELTPEKAVEIGILQSREYQTGLEELYLRSLSLTLNRFEFAVQWLGGNGTTFTHFGRGEGETNSLTNRTNLGFTKAFAAGGQLMADFANSFIYQYAGPNQATVGSNIVITLTQPLLRNFGRQVRMESLTQAERSLLYEVRRFARFRKQFTFDVATNTYLQLLLQEQAILNSQNNIKSLEQNYRLHRALNEIGTVDPVRVDLVFQSLQQGRAQLIRQQADLETAFDRYKATLGLPPTIGVKLDDSMLTMFQLSDPELEKIQGEIDETLTAARGLDPDTASGKLEREIRLLSGYFDRLAKLYEQVEKDLKKWQSQGIDKDLDPEVAQRQKDAKRDRGRDLAELKQDLARDKKKLLELAASVAAKPSKEDLEKLVQRAQDASADAAQMFVISTQVRVYLIGLKKVEYPEADALAYALENRLDLMNERAVVVDAWRQIEITANALQSGLDVFFAANIANTASAERPFEFNARASSYSVGARFDAPLNRYAERNTYRQAQIGYERTRRRFMSLSDEIQRQIRIDLRRLRAEGLNFEISRQTLISAARQLEQSREALLIERSPDPTSTQNILAALNNLLQAKNGLIGNYVNYEIGRYQLLLDLEALQLDERGLYTDESIASLNKPVDRGRDTNSGSNGSAFKNLPALPLWLY